jgi:threonyl-tRNA synthetase
VKGKILEAGYFVDVDDANSKQLQKKIRDSQLAQYNYILVVGSEEMEKGTVSVRTRDGVVHGSLTMSQLLDEFKIKTTNFQ